jgi:hypothetical protein
MNQRSRTWDQMGAASGLLATLLFVIAFIVFLGTSPGGDPSLPNVAAADTAPAFLAAHLSAIRVVVLLNSLGIALFLWFLGSLWTTLREAESEAGRGSTSAVIGGVAGSVLVLVGLALLATAGLSTSPGQADNVPTLYTASALLTALGGGVLSVFFFGVAKVVLQTHALGRWLGILAFVAGLISVLGFMTPFFEANVLNAATGALGRWAGSAAFVVWLFLASAAMTLEQRRLTHDDAPTSGAVGITEPQAGGEGGGQ